MKPQIKENRYKRIIGQLEPLFAKTTDPFARIATATAVLHNKMDHFFWTGYYRLIDGELTVTSYQGSVACLVLAKNTGVCWAGINQGKSIVVEDVENFPGHIACDSRSKSEIVVPVRNQTGEIVGVFDIDSKDIGAFDEIDQKYLEAITVKFYG
ncbi:MAG: GAF domain-containing protein [Candidatus Marinimicrobia bacterium]|nr:GAF domain-containing protein [Candidatus Neomarinimicrobiota bacterium]